MHIGVTESLKTGFHSYLQYRNVHQAGREIEEVSSLMLCYLDSPSLNLRLLILHYEVSASFEHLRLLAPSTLPYQVLLFVSIRRPAVEESPTFGQCLNVKHTRLSWTVYISSTIHVLGSELSYLLPLQTSRALALATFLLLRH